MKFAQDIILKPIITEKSMDGIASKRYTFKVATDAYIERSAHNILKKERTF